MKKKLIAVLLIVGMVFNIAILRELNAFNNPFMYTNEVKNEVSLSWDSQKTSIYHKNITEQRAYVHFSILNIDYYAPWIDDKPTIIGTVKTNTITNEFTYGTVGMQTYELHNFAPVEETNYGGYFSNIIGNPNTVKYNTLVVEEVLSDNQIATILVSDSPIVKLVGTGEYPVVSLDQNGNPQLDLNGDPIFTTKYGYALEVYDDSGYIDEPSIPPSTTFGAILEPGKKYKVYWTQGVTIENATIGDLPETSGSPFTTDGTIGTASFAINQDTNMVIRTINYGSDKYVLTPVYLESIDFLKNATNIYYYTDNGEKFLTFSKDEEPVILHNRFLSQKWTDTAIWNLNTGDLKIISKVTVYSHIQSGPDDTLFNLMYIPDVIIDSVVSVSLTFKYRYNYHITGPGAWQYQQVTVYKGDTVEVRPTWERKVLGWLSGNPWDILNTTFDVKVPVFPILQYGLTTVLFDNGYYKSIVDVYLNSVSNYTLKDAAEKVALEEKWSTVGGVHKPMTIDLSKNKIYELYLGQFSKFGSKNVEVEPMGLDQNTGYTEVIFVTNGTVRNLEFNQIVTIGSVEKDIEPSPDNKKWWEYIIEWLTKLGTAASLVVFIILGLFTIKFPVAAIETINGKKVRKARFWVSFIWLGLFMILWYWLI
ncbi:MAG: hypothetical protein QXM38_03530 [Candidatus Aenigmatarchaeota archaeon]